MNVKFQSSQMVCRNGLIVGAAMILGVGCASANDSTGDPTGDPSSDPTHVDEPETDVQNDPSSGSSEHTAGSQIRLQEGTDGPPVADEDPLTEIETQAISPHVAQTPGLDVSGYQPDVNWSSVASKGGKFVYIKATEGTGYRNPSFAKQYNGSYKAGLIRGAYHFARPDISSGTTQANYFVDHGGGWSADGKTLPGALDMEYNPYGATCYGLSGSSMVQWVRDFSNRVKARTNRYPTIYTSTSWWNQCTGGSGIFGGTNPLWVPRYGSSVGTLPAGWGVRTIWQYADSGTFPGDQNRFNGALDRLKIFAKSHD